MLCGKGDIGGGFKFAFQTRLIQSIITPLMLRVIRDAQMALTKVDAR